MKQTAVEWLNEQMNNIKGSSISMNGRVQFIEKELNKLLQQAKAMEKEQIMSAFFQGDIFGADYYDGVNPTEENYYNENFKSE